MLIVLPEHRVPEMVVEVITRRIKVTGDTEDFIPLVSMVSHNLG